MPHERELIGRSDFRGGWGHDKSMSIYFYFRSDVPMTGLEFASHGGMVPVRGAR